MLGALLAADVPNPEDPKGAPLGTVGDELTPERVNAMRHVGVKKVRVFAGYTTIDLRDDEQPTSTRERADPVLAFDVADPETGEVRGRGRRRADRGAAREAAQGRRQQGRGAAAGRRGRVGR